MRTQAFPMPDYDLALQDGKDGTGAVDERRDDNSPAVSPSPRRQFIKEIYPLIFVADLRT